MADQTGNSYSSIISYTGKKEFTPPKVAEAIYKYVDSLVDWRAPFVEGAAQRIVSKKTKRPIHRSTLYRWAKKYKEIAEAMRYLEDVRRLRLLEGGLYHEDTNSNFAKYLLSAMDGIVETNKSILSGDEKSPVNFGFAEVLTQSKKAADEAKTTS